MIDKTFDDLFNEFFKRPKPTKSDESDRIKEELKRMMDILSNFNMSNGIDEALEKEMDITLGEPDHIETYIEGNLFFEKRIWHTKSGDIVKLMVSDRPSTTVNTAKPETKTLEEQLKEAVAKEDYIRAAELRDMINPPKKKRTPAKKQKKSSDKNLES